MAVQVASLFGVLSLDDSDFNRGLKDADKGMKSAGDRLKDFSAGIKNVGAGMIAVSTPIVAFGVTAVRAAMESQQAMAQLDAVIKSTGGSAGVTAEFAQGLASTLQNVTMYGDEATMSAESMLLTFTNIGKDVFPYTTITALDMSTALGQDLTSSAMQLGKALNDPINGITALTRVGVTFTEEQKNTIKAMMDVGNIAGAQTIILNELHKEFGGSAEAAGKTFAGQLEILKNKFGEVQEKIGNVFLPILQRLVTDGIAPIVDKIARWVDQNPELVLQIGAAALGGLALGGALFVLGSVLPAVISGIGLLLSPVVLLAVAIGGLVFAADKLYPGGISQLLADASKAAQDLVQMGLLILVDTLNKAAGAASLLVGIVSILLITTLQNASIAAQQLVDIVKDWISKNQDLLIHIGNLGLALVLAIGILKLYAIGVAAAALASGAGAGLAGAITAATTAAWASVVAFVAPLIPIAALTLAIFALIEAYQLLQKTMDYLKKGGQDVVNAASTQIASGALSHDQFMDKAFNAAVSQFGDLGARLWWDQGYGRQISEGLWARSVAQAGVPARAMGGPVSAGGSYLVGEQGPELFTPSTSGNISTAGDTAAAMGGWSIYGGIHIHANSEAEGMAGMRGALSAARARGA